MKYYYAVLPLIVIVSVAACCGCSGVIKASLGQEVTLKPGQTVSITGEELEIEFIEVVEDSRCPQSVTCIWEGRARCSVRITTGEQEENAVLTQPGLYEGMTEKSYHAYTLSFLLEPYPETDKTISQDEYRLRLMVSMSE